ncbi:hypothetical protein llg_42060 [Luteolibacter sp. LG18]|nr:hypothetical protein llg_42060 [Luteolibacter sp. LG18]
MPGNMRVVFFVGEGEEPVEDDVVVVRGVPDDYAHLPAKVLGFFRQMLAEDDFGWLFKCDDDTYVALDRLRDLAGKGYDHVGDAAFMPGRRAASGGAGYLLSRRLVECLVADETLPATGAEDLIISGAAAVLCGGRFLATPRLCHHAKRYPRRDNDVVTSHWLDPRRMRAVHALCRAEPWHVMTISHAHWQDQVELHEDGTFARLSCDDGGTWDVDAHGNVHLRWFDYPADKIDLGEPRSGPERIVVRLQGGLGNQMFQYAAGLSLARRCGLPLEACWHEVSRGFALERFGVALVPSPAAGDCETFLVDDYVEGAEGHLRHHAARMNGGVVFMDGHFQNERLFADAAGEVAEFFLATFVPRATAVPDGYTPVGVHVRRGDFVNHPLHDLCGPGYYLAALERMRGLVERPWFLVVSDDPSWCREHLAAAADVQVMAPADLFTDFEILLGCAAHVISNSTFGWWAAWLAEHVRGGESHLVIGPDRFLRGRPWEILPERWLRLCPETPVPAPPPEVVPRMEEDFAWAPRLTPLHATWRDSMVEQGLAGTELPSINLAISSDEKGLGVNATLLHSIVRRTVHPVHLRCYCRGFEPESFHVRNLLVEFIRVDVDRGGYYPWWSHACSFDRLQVIHDHPAHWDRCWIMDHDQIATTDLARAYFEPFEGQLVQACAFGYKLRNACPLPEDLAALGDYDFYKMGPLLHLQEMRDDTWSRLLDLHARIGRDEQKSLVAATRGRLKVMDDRWNRIVYNGDLDKCYQRLFPEVVRPEREWYENYGILHYTGGPKPWWDASVENKPKKKERAWFKEYATWGQLRSGDWAVPEGCEVLEPAVAGW